MPHRRLRRAPRQAGRGCGVEPVLDDVQVVAAQVHDAEVVHLLVDQVELVIAIGGLDLSLQLTRALDRPGVERHQFAEWQGPCGLEAVQVAEQETHGIAHAAIGIAHAPQDLLRQAHLVGKIGGRHPQPQHVGAQGLDDVLRFDAVAQGLGHLAAPVVHGKSVGEHAAVRRPAIQGLGHQDRAVEPAAMLVRPLQVQIDRRLEIPAHRRDAFERQA